MVFVRVVCRRPKTTAPGRRAGPRRLHEHDAIRRSVAAGTKRWPLKFTAGNEASGARLSDNLAVVVHDLSATERRLPKSGHLHASIRRVLCIRKLVRIL